MILSSAEREFALQEQVIPNYQAVGDRRRDRLADGRLVVVASLVGSVNASKSLLQSKFG
jgi:hypothetical protein